MKNDTKTFIISLILFLMMFYLLRRRTETFTDDNYWKRHDPEFLKNADLSKFNMKIRDIGLKEENSFLAKLLLDSPVNSVFLDVGAYTGDTSLAVSEILNREGRKDIEMIAFEPNMSHCKTINQTARKLGYNLICINVVVSDKKGVMYSRGSEGSGTVYTDETNGKSFPTDTLDNLLGGKDIFLLKIDVEGHEVEVLRGAKKTLQKTNHVYIEMWNDEHLKDRGYDKTSSHNKLILNELKNFYPIQKMEKNVFFTAKYA